MQEWRRSQHSQCPIEILMCNSYSISFRMIQHLSRSVYQMNMGSLHYTYDQASEWNYLNARIKTLKICSLGVSRKQYFAFVRLHSQFLYITNTSTHIRLWVSKIDLYVIHLSWKNIHNNKNTWFCVWWFSTFDRVYPDIRGIILKSNTRANKITKMRWRAYSTLENDLK